MEVYILDSLYRRVTVVDLYESLIWTERFSAKGDFELHLHSTLENRTLFPPGTRIAQPNSHRVMTVETVEDTEDEEGRDILVLKGTSLENVLEQRLAKGNTDDLTTTPKWVITDVPAEIARTMFHDICVTGVVDSGDIIAGINETNVLFPADTIDEPSDTITYELDLISLYEATKNLCEIYHMGFRLVRHPNTAALYYDIYMGSDRTTLQTALPAVVFSPGLDNLKNPTELTSIALYKNVAYVFSPVGFEVVYADGVDPTVAGFERKVLFVKAEDITSGVPATATAQMIQRGMEELAKHRKISAFDGEVAQYSSYDYGTDFHLGDLVELQNTDGVSSIVQVTEQIFISDNEGDRSFPTLSITKFITPGSWDSWTPDEAWDDVSGTLVWDDAS